MTKGRIIELLRKEVREANSNVEDYRDSWMKAKKETEHLEETNKSLNNRILGEIASLAAEHIDLTGRLFRINARIKSLGFDPITVIKWAINIPVEKKDGQ